MGFLDQTREKPPCAGCCRDNKRPGCHDRCDDYNAWKQRLAELKKKRKEYIALYGLTKKERRYGN